MRKIVFISAFFAVLVLSSCDKNIGRVEKATKDFFEAVSDKDKVGYCALYPALRNSKTLTVKPSLKCEDIDVDYSKDDSTYISTINDKHKLYFKINEDNECEIVNSQNVLQFDSVYYELAAKTGLRIKELTDLKVDSLRSDEGEFISFLSSIYPMAATGNIKASNQYYSWMRTRSGYGECYFTFNVKNCGAGPVKGEDYTIEAVVYNRNTDKEITRTSTWGVDLGPDVTEQRSINCDIVYNLAKEENIYYRLNFNFKGKSRAAVIDKYGELLGTEYDDFINMKEFCKKDWGVELSGTWHTDWKAKFILWKGKIKIEFDDGDIWDGRVINYDESTGELKYSYTSSKTGSADWDSINLKVNNDKVSCANTDNEGRKTNLTGKVLNKKPANWK